MLLRGMGVAAAAAWASLALVDRTAWPRLGLLTLAVSAAAAIALRPVAVLVPRALMAPSRRVFVAGCALAATGISWWFVHSVLRGMPLVIDAAIYLLQAHAMSHLHFGMPIPSPFHAFSNRFLLEGPDGRLYGVFPPGWPLALVPFVWARVPMLVGPALAALLVVGQAQLGRVVALAAGDDEGGELATRASLLLTLPSYGRAIQTGDLLSHAFVAVLTTVAMTLAIDSMRKDRAAAPPQSRSALLIGACVGWALAARLLDGVVLALAVAGLLVWRRAGWRAMPWAALGSLPFVLLLCVEQRTATGGWLLPTQSVYFTRSDWPPGCHGLSLHPGAGCTYEHKHQVEAFGPNGYSLANALHVVRERCGALGEDLLGFAPLALLGFAPLAIGASAADAVGIAFLLALTLAYSLFYYGNAPMYGARHLFGAAPFVWLLVARGAARLPHRARGWLDGAHVRGASVAVLLIVASVSARGPWSKRGSDAAQYQANRSDLRGALALHGVDRGIVESRDQSAVAVAFDPWVDADDRLFVLQDNSGLLELRRAHPRLPLFLSLPGGSTVAASAARPPPGVLVELERTWPSFVRPMGLAATPSSRDGASGKSVLLLSHAQPGARATMPFEVAVPGDYLVRVDGIAGPDQGNYALTLDGAPLSDWHGYSGEPGPARGEASRRTLTAERHELVARCLGRDDASQGYDAQLDALVGEVAQPD